MNNIITIGGTKMNVIKEYFNVEIKWDDIIPRISFKLKVEYKIKPYPRMSNGKMPLSSSVVEYFIYYLGTDIGTLVYKERKKLFPKESAIKWCIDNLNLTEEVKELMNNNIIAMRQKLSCSLRTHYDSPAGIETRQKLKRRSTKWAPIIGKMNSERWKDEEWVAAYKNNPKVVAGHKKGGKKQSERYKNDPEYRSMVLTRNRQQSRKDKISAAAKKMWQDAKLYDKAKFYRMITSSKNKKYECNGHNMNSIEYLIAITLNELGVVWRYEDVFMFTDNTYIPDFYIPESNLVIECYGDFWHANPTLFAHTDTTHSNRTAKMVWEYDENKKRVFLDNSINYHYIYETDINNNLEHCKQQIKELL